MRNILLAALFISVLQLKAQVKSNVSGNKTKSTDGMGKPYVLWYNEPAPNTPVGFDTSVTITNFSYSNLQLSEHKLSVKDSLIITVDITNTGKWDGDEIVQLYVNDEVSSVTTYEKVLRGFERIHLKAGETKKVRFKLMMKDIGLYNTAMKYITESVWFKIWVATSSEHMKLEDRFEVTELLQ